MAIVATILLTADSQYVVGQENKLPLRPKHDKELLTSLSIGETVSQKGYDMLPPSIRKNVKVTKDKPTFPVTIKEINDLADILLVSHSTEINPVGKVFDLNRSFKLLAVGKWVSVWKKKSNEMV